MDKSPDAFRTISEVASDLDLPQHVLRFWETRFNQIRPLKRGGGRRYYRPDDVDLLKGIRHLLYGEGYTIRGVQRILKEQGVRFVTEVWREGAPQPSTGGDRFADDASPRWEEEAPAEAWEADADDAGRADPSFDVTDDTGPLPSDVAPAPPLDPELRAAQTLAQRFAPRPAGPIVTAPGPVARVEPSFADRRPAPPEPPRSGLGAVVDRFRGSLASPQAPAAVHVPVHAGLHAEAAGGSRLARDDVRRLQATLFELLECKRLLDQVR